MRNDRSISILICLVVLPLAARAHHSWRAVYDGGEEVVVDATVTSEVFRNPHLTLRVEIVNEAGEPEPWTVEWRGGRRRDGEAPVVYDLSPGDEVVIEGQVARFAGGKKIQMRTLTRPADGMTIEARGRGDRGRR